MSDIEAMRQLAKQLTETAKELEGEVEKKEALEAAHVPDSFDDFASFFQSDFQWQVMEVGCSYWRLKALPLTEAAKKCIDSLLNKEQDVFYGTIRDTMGIREFYRDSTPSTPGSFIYFKAIGGLVGIKALLEKLPNLKLVVSKEGREIIEQGLRSENDRLEEARKVFQEKQEVFNRVELLDGESEIQ